MTRLTFFILTAVVAYAWMLYKAHKTWKAQLEYNNLMSDKPLTPSQCKKQTIGLFFYFGLFGVVCFGGLISYVNCKFPEKSNSMFFFLFTVATIAVAHYFFGNWEKITRRLIAEKKRPPK